jgi:hypothetical protein
MVAFAGLGSTGNSVGGIGGSADAVAARFLHA